MFEFKKKMEDIGITVNVIHFKNVNSFPYLFNAKRKAQQFILAKNVNDPFKRRSILSAYIFCEKANDLVALSIRSYDLTIIDRYYESALCYHYLRGELCKEIYEIYSQLIKTDLNVFMELPPDICFERLVNRTKLSLYETKENLDRAYYFYHTYCKQFWKIDASLSSDEITEQIYLEILKHFF